MAAEYQRFFTSFSLNKRNLMTSYICRGRANRFFTNLLPGISLAILVHELPMRL
jgi:hypothetical protein